MIDQIVINFEAFAEIYIHCLVIAYIICVAFLLSVWLKPFVKTRRAAYLAAGTYLVLRVIYYSIPIENDFLRKISFAIVPVTFLLSWLLDERRNPVQKLFLSILYYLMSWLTYEIATEIGLFERDFVCGFDWYYSNANAIAIDFIVWNLIQYAFAAVILYVSVRFVQKAYRRKMEELSWKELLILLAPFWTILLVKPIMLAYFTLWMDGMANGNLHENIPSSIYRLVFCVLSLLSLVVIITLYQEIKEGKEKEFSRQALEKQAEDLQRHMRQIENMYERVRSMRHDMGNHMAVIEGLIDSGEKDSLSEYIRQWKKNYDESTTAIKTGNPIMDVAISEFAGRFEEAGIPFEQAFRFPEELQINPFDLCIAITNALQNALEASLDSEMPSVKLTSIMRNRTFIVNLKNRIDRKVYINPDDEIPVSIKKEDGHGYGLKNIRMIAQKYNGDIEIRQEAEGEGYMFVLNIMFIG